MNKNLIYGASQFAEGLCVKLVEGLAVSGEVTWPDGTSWTGEWPTTGVPTARPSTSSGLWITLLLWHSASQSHLPCSWRGEHGRLFRWRVRTHGKHVRVEGKCLHVPAVCFKAFPSR